MSGDKRFWRRDDGVWADTRGVQRAVSTFAGDHIGFGDFAVRVDLPSVPVGHESVRFQRMDSYVDRESFPGAEGRMHLCKGSALTIERMVLALEPGLSLSFEGPVAQALGLVGAVYIESETEE